MNEFEDYAKHLSLLRAASRAYRVDDGEAALKLLPDLLGHLTYWRSVAQREREVEP